jgi:hypothetical protein
MSELSKNRLSTIFGNIDHRIVDLVIAVQIEIQLSIVENGRPVMAESIVLQGQWKWIDSLFDVLHIAPVPVQCLLPFNGLGQHI